MTWQSLAHLAPTMPTLRPHPRRRVGTEVHWEGPSVVEAGCSTQPRDSAFATAEESTPGVVVVEEELPEDGDDGGGTDQEGTRAREVPRNQSDDQKGRAPFG